MAETMRRCGFGNTEYGAGRDALIGARVGGLAHDLAKRPLPEVVVIIALALILANRPPLERFASIADPERVIAAAKSGY